MNILVLESDALAYKHYLSDLEHSVTYAQSPEKVTEAYDVLLARPDYVAEYVQAFGEPHWIQSTWAGIRPLTGVIRKAQVTGVKGVFGPLMSEYVFAYLLEDIRDLPRSYRQQAETNWQPYVPQTLQNRHMVVVGTGSIGKPIASTAKTFGMRVSGVSRTGVHCSEFDRVMTIDALSKAAQDADYLVLVLPDTPNTQGIIDAQILAALPSDSMLINVGRGASLDHDALAAVLTDGKLRRAVLDVFPTEPLPSDSPLWMMPNLTITPHISAVSYPQDIAKLFLDNLQKYERGEPLDFLVDLAQGY